MPGRGHEELQQKPVTQKRPIVTSDLSEEEPERKRCKFCSLQEDYDDYIVKKKAFYEAEKKWRANMDSLECIKYPETEINL